MKYKVLVSAPYFQPVIDRYRGRFAKHDIELLTPVVEERLNEAQLLRVIDRVHGVISGDDEFTERVLRAAPQLKVISKWGTGIDSIDREACRRLGVAVLNTPNAFTEPVADTVLGYVLAFARQLPWMDQAMKRGAWEKIPSVSLSECTLSIIGLGNIGRAVARRARAFGMALLGHDTVPPPDDFVASVDIQMVTRDECLRRADFLSLNCDLNPSSLHLVDESALSLLSARAVVINTARGPIIDQPALERALVARQIAGAALDVFEDEPLPLDSPLRKMSNVLIAPHNSNSSPRAWERVHERTVENLLNALLAQAP